MMTVIQLLVFSTLLSTVAMQECSRECAVGFFRAVDSDRNGIRLEEIESYVDLLDENCDGGVTRDEVVRKFSVLKPGLLQCVDGIFTVLDQNKDGRITKPDGVVDFLFADSNHDFVKTEAEFVAYWNRRCLQGKIQCGQGGKTATKPKPRISTGLIDLTLDI